MPSHPATPHHAPHDIAARLRTATPHERLSYFLKLVDPRHDAQHTVQEVCKLACEELIDLGEKLLSEAGAKALKASDFQKRLHLNEVDAFEHLSVGLLAEIAKCWAIPNGKQNIASQFYCDGFDAWLDRQDIHRVTTMVVACGVQPVLVKQLSEKSRAHLNDFLITIIWPEKHEMELHGDWLATVYAKNEAPSVEEVYGTPLPESTPPPEGAPGFRAPSPVRMQPTTLITEDDTNKVGSSNDVERKRARSPSTVSLDGDSSVGRLPTDAASTSAFPVDDQGDLIISEETLPKLLSTRPDLVPREIMKAHRKDIAAGITEFALVNHYQMNELRDFVKENDVPCERKKLKTDLAQSILAYLKQKAE